MKNYRMHKEAAEFERKQQRKSETSSMKENCWIYETTELIRKLDRDSGVYIMI